MLEKDGARCEAPANLGPIHESFKMPSFLSNIENRVRKLPKPASAGQALQPVFEAVSNAFFAIEDRRDGGFTQRGEVCVRVSNLSDTDRLRVEVHDNGIGLDPARYVAFRTIDTDFKRQKGGKGVGRLFWLDAFKSVKVESQYVEQGRTHQLSFEFCLNNSEQFVLSDEKAIYLNSADTGTVIVCEGLRGDEYKRHFSKQPNAFLRHFSAHFIADFLVGSSPSVIVDIDGDRTEYPNKISDLVVGSELKIECDIPNMGTFKIQGFTCRREASTGLDGNHHLHFLADGRTVETRSIDGLIAIKSISKNGEDGLLFHGCVSSEYLNARVNEGRTAFTLPEAALKEITRACTDRIKETAVSEQIDAYKEKRASDFKDFVKRYPIYGFDLDEVQLSRVPFSASGAEDFAAGLVKFQIRSEEQRLKAMEKAIRLVDSDGSIEDSFEENLLQAVNDMQSSERLALAQHVVRRKLVLDLMDKLIKKVRKQGDKRADYHLEKTLHSFIVPMNVKGDDHTETRPRGHDLWILDERLAFTRAFSSDKRFNALLSGASSSDRADLIVWDFAAGLGIADRNSSSGYVDTSEPLNKVMIVEFKRPGRTSYRASDQIAFQINKYINELRGGEIQGFEGQRIRVSKDCTFHCYVVADIVGDLEVQLSGWAQTSKGQGRIMPLQGDLRGFIEIIQWQDMVNDAWARNEAVLNAGGLFRA